MRQQRQLITEATDDMNNRPLNKKSTLFLFASYTTKTAATPSTTKGSGGLQVLLSSVSTSLSGKPALAALRAMSVLASSALIDCMFIVQFLCDPIGPGCQIKHCRRWYY